MAGFCRTLWLSLAVAAAYFGNPEVLHATEGHWESRFLDELVTPGATRWTAEFNAYRPDSYFVDKIVLARKLPDHARRRGRDLQALIVVGPTGGIWTYYVIAVFREGEKLRVNEVVLPHARITGKRTGLVGRAVVDGAVQAVVEAGVLIPAVSLDNLSRRLDAQERIDWQLRNEKHQRRSLGDFRFDLLVGVYDDEAPSYWYGQLDSNRKADVDAALGAINALLKRTHQTYEHGQGTARKQVRDAVSESPFRGRIYGQGMLVHDAQPALGSALAGLGYSTVNTTQPALGIGAGVAGLRGRLALDLVLGVDRPFRGPGGQAGAIRREAFILTAGYDVWDEGQVAVYPFAGVASSFLNVQLDRGATGPFSGSAARTDDEQFYGVSQTAWVVGLGLEHVMPFAARRERHRGGLELGLRLGLIRGPDTRDWRYIGENASDDTNVDGPNVRLGGVFGILELGFGDLR
ncbi:MAG: hypothetical protein IT377_22435 [Polyangiaceae bacterium]|nr:hypothetical protein [Polyangiaceae bacterium]